MSNVMGLHPKSEAKLRQSKPFVAGIPNFRCKRCKTLVFSFAGRKKHPIQGWICAGCIAIK